MARRYDDERDREQCDRIRTRREAKARRHADGPINLRRLGGRDYSNEPGTAPGVGRRIR